MNAMLMSVVMIVNLITTVDSAVAYDNPKLVDMSLLLINQAMLIPSIKIS